MKNPGRSIGDFLTNLIPANRVSYAAPAAAPVAAPAKAFSTIDPAAQAAFKQAYQKYNMLPYGTLEALYHQESSGGVNRTNASNDAGRYGYMFGITQPTWNDYMTRQGQQNVPPLQKNQLDTVGGAAQAAAAIFAQKQADNKRRGLPADIKSTYATGYSSGKLGASTTQNFSDAFDHYNSQYFAPATPTTPAARTFTALNQ